MVNRGMTRRQFVKTAGAATGLSLAANTARGAVGANERIVVGFIGTGGQAAAHLNELIRMDDVVVTGLCDVDAGRREAAAKVVGGSPKLFGDFRKLLEMKELDAVFVVTPDHWHAIPTIQALDSGKHVYFEKPAAHNIREGRAIVEAAERSGRVAQIGTQQRSGRHWQNAVARIKDGELGKISMVHAWNAWNPQEMFGNIGRPEDSAPPKGVDYDFWLGPAPKRPFNPSHFHGTWYFFWDYAGAMISGWGVHLFDVVLWAMGPGIKTVSTAGGRLVFDDVRETPDTATAVFECPGYTLTYSMRHGNGWRPHGDMDHGIEFFGTEGTLQINRGGYQVYRDSDRSSRKPLHSERMEGHDYTLFEHKRHFFDCIRTGSKCQSDALTGHLSSIPGHLANISYRVGRKIAWDAQEETIVDDREATRFLGREYRSPWRL